MRSKVFQCDDIMTFFICFADPPKDTDIPDHVKPGVSCMSVYWRNCMRHSLYLA